MPSALLGSDIRSRHAGTDRRVTRLMARVILIAVLAVCGYAADTKIDPTAPKVEKVFYTPKDRITAIHNATIYAPKAVAEANIGEGPAQKKRQFQLHFHDKVVCDYDKPGAEKHGNTPKF